MSNCLSRLMAPTGYEFYDIAIQIDKHIWNFIKYEYKKKSKDEQGNIPTRYWYTHAVPLHNECWNLISDITYANSIIPHNEIELEERKKAQRSAIARCKNIFQLINLTLIELPNINANKLNFVLSLLDKEYNVLVGWLNSSKIRI